MRFLKNRWLMFRSAETDNVVFKLYYRITVLILLFFSFVITCRLLFGNSFHCISSHDVTNTYVDVYCYANRSYIITSALSQSTADVIYPGVKGAPTQHENLVYVPYYPWVNLFFLVLAVLFYLPHLVWKVCEGGLMARLTCKVNDISVTEAERKEAIIEIAKYVIVTRGGHLAYAGVSILCEALNWLVGVLLTVWLVNFFNVRMSFSSLEFEMESWDDFFRYNFPLMARCDYNMYGASGGVQVHYCYCQLPLNNLYGYMFLFLYAWFILLCVLQALVLPYRVLGLILPPIRLLLFRVRSGITDDNLLSFVAEQFSLGDWFLLTRLQKNLFTHDLTKLLRYAKQNFNTNPTDLEMNDLGKLE